MLTFFSKFRDALMEFLGVCFSSSLEEVIEALALIHNDT